MLIMNLYYIHTEKYSPKSCVVNFDTQMSSSQSAMVFTREKNDTSNQNRERGFLHVRKWYVQSETTEVCELLAKIPAFSCSMLSATSHTFEERSFSQRVFFSLKKLKNISEMEWNSFVCFTVDKENCGEPAKQQRKGKNNKT